MTEDQANAEIKNGPILLSNGGVSALCSYRVSKEGVYFSEKVAKKSTITEGQVTLEDSEQVNFTSQYTILNSFGPTYNIGHVDKLLRANAASVVFD